MTLITPREEQRKVVKQIKTVLSDHPSVLVVAPTGYGKTVVLGDLARDEILRGGSVLVMVGLQVLLGQTVVTVKHGFGVPVSALHDKITSYRFGGSIIPLSCDYLKSKVLVTLPETFKNTTLGLNDLYLCPSFKPSLIIYDEAHKATSEIFRYAREYYPFAKYVGFTATPKRTHNEPGESLEEWYGDRVIVASTIAEEIEKGNLVAPQYKLYSGSDHVAKTWKRVTEDYENKRTIVFTDDTNHSKLLEKQFKEEGVPVEVITAGKGVLGDSDYVPRQSQTERDKIFERFTRGETLVLISVNALCEGFDEPAAKFCFLTRRVANIALYQQMVGRVLRKFIGKRFGIVCDFAGNFSEHGPVEAIMWPEAAKGYVVSQNDVISAKSFSKRTNAWLRCESCGHVYNIKKSKKCTHCGAEHNVRVVTTVKDKVRETLGLSEKEFEVMVSRLNAALSGILPHDAFNKRCNAEVFKDNKLNDDFQYLGEVVELYKKAPVRNKSKVWNAELKLAA